MKFALLAVALLSAGCGGPDFSGTYSGDVNVATTCSDGTSGTTSRTLSWQVADKGDELTIDPLNGTCGAMSADTKGNTAALRTKVCPPVASNGSTAAETLLSGTLTLKDRAISVLLNSNVSVSGAAGNGTCQTVATGTLSRP